MSDDTIVVDTTEPAVNRADTKDMKVADLEAEEAARTEQAIHELIPTTLPVSSEPPITIGRVVVYHMQVGLDVEDLAAQVTKAWGPKCANLRVLEASGCHAFGMSSVSKADYYGQPGRWSYPTRS